jgi:DNA-binding NarL/FixJ family response regulator
VGVLVVTMVEDDDTVFAAMRAGARGYLLKGAGPVEIERALRAVAAGEVLLAPKIAATAVAMLTGSRRRGPDPFPSLTDRECDVLELVAHGLDNRRIAQRLALSEKTVRNNLSTVLTKLGVADRAAAIAKARDAGLGSGGV